MNEVDIKFERHYLEQVKKYIVDYREKLSQDFADVATMYKGRYNQVKWGDEDLVSNQQKMIENKRKKMINLENKPYFGKFSFRDNNVSKDETIYIGKTNVNDINGQMLVTDWRTPVCSLFYEQKMGNTYYETPTKKVSCDILSKYLIQIENGELIDVVDASSISNDEILTSYLTANNEVRLKNIIASIQEEQNIVIRKPLNCNLIVQGVAGSGKTTVALHRAAYLLYVNDKYSADDFMIFGPNKYFLNYISALLPDLDTENINQFTYEDFTKFYFDGRIKVIDTKEIDDKYLLKTLKFKSTMEFKKMIDEFVENYIEKVLSEDIMLKDNILFSKDMIKLNIKKGNLSNSAETTRRFLISKIKEEKDYYDDKFLRKYRLILRTLDKQDPLATDIINYMNFIKENLNNNCKEVITNYFKPLKIKPIDIYKKFIESIESIPNFLPEEVELLKKTTLESIKKRSFTFEELPALLYLNTILCEASNDCFNNYGHVLVDEGQDLGEFHYYMLKKIFKSCTFSIFGDLAQSIYPGRGIDDWHKVGKIMELNNLEYLQLTKSYRTTKEITNNANSILNYLNIPISNPVLRSGEEIDYFKTEVESDEIELITLLLEDYIEKKYKSFGIISKNQSDCQKVYQLLEKNGIKANLINSNSEEYVGGICILTAELSKGLEFDKVLLLNADTLNYNENDSADMKLLYVAATRALHELTISYQHDLVAPFEEKRLTKLKNK